MDDINPYAFGVTWKLSDCVWEPLDSAWLARLGDQSRAMRPSGQEWFNPEQTTRNDKIWTALVDVARG